MKKSFFISVFVILGIFILGYALFGLPAFLVGSGTLAGRVSIGPICPVEGIGMNCSPSPEHYTSQELVITRSWWPNSVVASVHPDGTGHYSISLPAGDYLLQVATTPFYKQSLPITIQSDNVTTQDISIDTGIR